MGTLVFSQATLEQREQITSHLPATMTFTDEVAYK